MWDTAKTALILKREIYSITDLPQEKNIYNKQSNLKQKKIERKNNKAQSEWEKGNNKDHSRNKQNVPHIQ